MDEALSGDTVAVKVSELPSTRVREDLLRVTPVTVTAEGLGLDCGCSVGPQPVNTQAKSAETAAMALIRGRIFFISRLLIRRFALQDN